MTLEGFNSTEPLGLADSAIATASTSRRRADIVEGDGSSRSCCNSSNSNSCDRRTDGDDCDDVGEAEQLIELSEQRATNAHNLQDFTQEPVSNDFVEHLQAPQSLPSHPSFRTSQDDGLEAGANDTEAEGDDFTVVLLDHTVLGTWDGSTDTTTAGGFSADDVSALLLDWTGLTADQRRFRSNQNTNTTNTANNNINNTNATEMEDEVWERRRRYILLRELDRVQRSSFLQTACLCSVPMTLVLIVLALAFSDRPDCSSSFGTCELEPRSFMNAYTTRCICTPLFVHAIADYPSSSSIPSALSVPTSLSDMNKTSDNSHNSTNNES